MSGVTNPPRHHNAEDLSGRERAQRRGGLTQTEFLEKMRFVGFVPTPGSIDHDAPNIEFSHPVLATRRVRVNPLENFSAAFERMCGMLAEMVIVKLQKPLGGWRDDLWLAYPEDKSWRLLIPRATIPLAVRTVVDRTFKSFFYGKRIGDAHAVIFGGQAPDQSW
jgi:hypothetical protein